MYQLTRTDGDRRTYESTEPGGGSLTTYLLRTDRQGNKWWAFEDLFGVPFIRTFAANHVVRLYGHGLTAADVKAQNQEQRGILRSTDPEKVEKAIAHTYECDRVADQLADPVKQCVGLATVYLLLNDERPDVYVMAEQTLKMSILALEPDLQAFFFTWWTGVIERYGKDFNGNSRTVFSKIPPMP